MNWATIIQLIVDLILRLRQMEANNEIQRINWEQLLKYLPEILDLVMRIIRDMQGGQPGLSFANEEVKERFQAMGGATSLEPQAIDWARLIDIILELIRAIQGTNTLTENKG